MDDEMNDTGEEDGSLADVRRMLQAAEGRLQNLNRNEALNVVQRTLRSLSKPKCGSEGIPDIMESLEALELNHRHEKALLSDNGREIAIALLLDIVKVLEEPFVFAYGFDEHARVFSDMPQVISDIVSIRGILNYFVLGKDYKSYGLFPILERLGQLSRNYTKSSPWVNAAANEGFVALAEITLSDNKGFDEAMATFVIQAAQSHDKIAGKKELLDRMTSIVEEIRADIKFRQQEAGVTVDAPAFEKRPVPEKSAIPTSPKPLKTKG